MLGVTKAKEYFKKNPDNTSGVATWWNPETGDRAHLYKHEVRLIAKHIKRLFKEPSEAKFLELAAGGGRVRSWLGKNHLRILENNTDYKCLDINKKMLDLARKRFSAEGIQATFIKASVDDIPLPNNSVDAVICVESFVHFENLDRALSEASRVLKQGGILISNIDYTNSLRRVVKRVVDFMNYRINEKYEHRGKGIFRTYTDKEYCALLERNNFEIEVSERYGIFAAIDIAVFDKNRRFYVLPPSISRFLFPLDKTLSGMPLVQRLATYYLTVARKG